MHRVEFLRAFFRNWKEVGWPLETSQSVARKICQTIDFQHARCIVEVGAGTGRIAREILKSLRPDGKLIAFEIDPALCQHLRAIRDRRLVIHNSSGFEMAGLLQHEADYVISEIPIATLSGTALAGFYETVNAVLKQNGACIQLQLSLFSYSALKRMFRTVKIAFAPLNPPPLFIYQCRDWRAE